MTDAEAERLIARGRRALERRDGDAILGMMSPEARILGRNMDDLRQILPQSIAEVRGSLTVATRNLRTKQTGVTAEMTFDIDIGQSTKGMSATYFMNHHFTVKLEKRRSTHLLGLYRTEDWLVTEIISDPKIEMPML